MATGVQIYTSADASAPQMYGDAGKLTDILDAVLVNGYGSRTPAGTTPGAGAWTISFTATNKRIYRPSAGNRFYLRVNDAAAGIGGAKEALVRVAESWSDIDTPTNPMPTDAQSALTEDSLIVRKSVTADAITARPWLIAADDRTLMMFIKSGDGTGVEYTGWMFGDLYSIVSSDGYRTQLIARSAENSISGSTSIEAMMSLNIDAGGVQNGHYIQRNYLAAAGAIQANKGETTLTRTSVVYSVGVHANAYPHGPDGDFYCLPVYIREPVTVVVRGRMRGFWQGMHAASNFNDGDVFSGKAGTYLAGRTFRIIKATMGSGYYIIETSDTWDTSS